MYRNFDWNYDNTAEFKVVTKNFKGMSYVNGIVDGDIEGHDEYLGQMPYRMLDGTNKYGIMVSAHVVYNDWGYTGSGDKNVSIRKIPYIILNNIKSMDDLESNEELQNALSNIYIPERYSDNEMLLQYLVSDGVTTCAIIPPVFSVGDYSIEYCNDYSSKMTNFRWYDAEYVSLEDSDMQYRPNGVERFNEIADGATLEQLRFTQAYETDTRLSEFIGMNGTSKESSDEDLYAIWEAVSALYPDRERDGTFWQTLHSIVYSKGDIEHLWTQENYNIDYCSGSSSGGGSVPHIKTDDESIFIGADPTTGEVDTKSMQLSVENNAEGESINGSVNMNLGSDGSFDVVSFHTVNDEFEPSSANVSMTLIPDGWSIDGNKSTDNIEEGTNTTSNMSIYASYFDGLTISNSLNENSGEKHTKLELLPDAVNIYASETPVGEEETTHTISIPLDADATLATQDYVDNALNDAVTVDTAQTISGQKEFNSGNTETKLIVGGSDSSRYNMLLHHYSNINYVKFENNGNADDALIGYAPNYSYLFVTKGLAPGTYSGSGTNQDLGTTTRKWNNVYCNKLTGGLDYLTTAPTSANTDGIKIVRLSSEPATKYEGYLYIIDNAE